MDTRDTAAGRRTQPEDGTPAPDRIDATSRELAALRERLRAVEAALDLPARPGRPSPPPLRTLLERVAALERRAAGVPGLPPLPGCPRSGPSSDPVAAVVPPARWLMWRERGQGLLAAALALALCAWLLRPPPGHAAPARTVAAPATVVVTAAATGTPARVLAVPPASPTATWPPCEHDSDAGCPWNAAVPVAPAASPTSPRLPCDTTVGGFCVPGDRGDGAMPCPLGRDTPCGGGASSGGRTEPGPLPDDRICPAER